MIEDAPVGIEAACAAGMVAIGFTGMHDRDALTVAGASHIVDELPEVTVGLVAHLLERKAPDV